MGRGQNYCRWVPATSHSSELLLLYYTRVQDPTRASGLYPEKRRTARPLGIPTVKDRVMQAIVKMALEPEWEAKFEANSYGFRPGRGCHDAIEAIHNEVVLAEPLVTAQVRAWERKERPASAAGFGGNYQRVGNTSQATQRTR